MTDGLIPEGFSLDKYKDSSSLDVYQWVANIESRALIESIWLTQRFNNKPITEEIIEDLKIRNKNNIKDGFFIRDFGDSKVGATNVHEAFLHPMNIPDHNQVTRILDSSLIDENDPAVDDINEHPAFKNMSRAFVVIDLNAPDDVLEQAFRKWLKKTKKNQQRASTKIQSKLRDWVGSKVIEYIDLTQWHTLRGTKINAVEIESILFPTRSLNDYKISEEVVALAEKHKKELLNEQFTSRLLAQRMKENWEGMIPFVKDRKWPKLRH